MSQLRYDGRVAIVTGAGNGLGRTYALELAKRGAKVVVNDLGGSTKGEGRDTSAADKVVAEIKSAGGQAVANYDSVVNGAAIVKTAIDAFGQIDIVINNAGILNDTTFIKLTDAQWNLMQQVHLNGAYSVTHAAWPYLQKQKYGRVIMVTSAAGLYGNFGQSHYSTVKMGILGLAQTLALEGAKSNIRVNVIAPIAGSRMTETVMPPDLIEALKPDYVAPLVLYLTHDSSQETGGVYELGAGWISKLRWQRTKGVFFPLDSEKFTMEAVQQQIGKITDFNGEVTYPSTPRDAFEPIMANLANPITSSEPPKKEKASKGGDSSTSVDVAAALAYSFPALTFNYSEKDVILYALGIGAGSDPMDESDRKYVYEGADDFQTLPTFGVVVPSDVLAGMMSIPGLTFNPMMLLHGEQYLEIRRPIPTSGALKTTARVSNILDKGKGALVLLDATTKDEAGNDVIFNQYSLFIRGLGGFSSSQKVPAVQATAPPAGQTDPPLAPPDVVHREKTLDNQAVLYRLSGDRNPLHIDPSMASMGGFAKPILHGLCSFGYASRAVIKHMCNNDATRLKSIRVRFVSPVYPGETLVTEMWRVTPTRILFRCKVAERGEYVLSNSVIELFPLPGQEQKETTTATPAAAAPTKSTGSKAEAVFAELKSRASADLVKKINSIYRFDITRDGTSHSWLLNLKEGSGSVSQSDTAAKADCIIAITDDDFVELMNGKLNAQQAFMKGKIKIKGNMMLAQKLSLLQSAAPAKTAAPAAAAPAPAPAPAAAAPAPAAAPAGGSFKAEGVFAALTKQASPDLVAKIKSTYRFDITKGGASRSWLLNLKEGSGSVSIVDASTKADCMIAITDDDFVELMNGKLNAQQAFMKGKIKIKGNMMLAQKLSLLQQKPSKL